MLTRATERLGRFPGFLRANGFGTAGGDAVQTLRAAERTGVLDQDVLRWSLKALLCRRGDEWRRFDELFDAWFLPANRWQRAERRETAEGAQSDAHPGGSREGERTD
ncbi:MAG TPA: carbon monoxide dehydrogenase, partial [Burkholderiales bacterium]|nr:carbon monoxide dehydrogenase [Burkholderiales bacterium]